MLCHSFSWGSTIASSCCCRFKRFVFVLSSSCSRSFVARPSCGAPNFLVNLQPFFLNMLQPQKNPRGPCLISSTPALHLSQPSPASSGALHEHMRTSGDFRSPPQVHSFSHKARRLSPQTLEKLTFMMIEKVFVLGYVAMYVSSSDCV